MYLEFFNTSKTVAKGRTCLLYLWKSTDIRQLAVLLTGVKYCLRDKQNFKEMVLNKILKRKFSHNWTVNKHLKIVYVWNLTFFC